jgi:hypothetical protein
MAPRRRELPSDPNGARIVKALDPITATGMRQDDVFEDWLEVVEACLEAMPAHARAMATSGAPADDTAETLAIFKRLRQRYGERPWVFEAFAQAFAILLDAAYEPDGTPTYQDLLGQIYMAWGYPSSGLGQYFTPWPLARAMADMTTDRGQLVHERLKAAIAKSPLAQAAVIAGLMCQEPAEAFEWFTSRVVPACIEHFERVKVSDPACGSGVMLLACASTYPRWMVELGLVMFYGQDLDGVCVRMCRINAMLYGLNGHAIRDRRR